MIVRVENKNRTYYDRKWCSINAFIRKLLVYECKEKVESVKKMLKVITKNESVRNKHILDVGFGDGNILMLFKGNHICGVEVSQVAINRFRKAIISDDFLSTSFKFVTNDSRLCFSDEIMDIVILSHVLEHIVDVDNIMMEVRRVLKKNGLLFLLLPINERFYQHPGHCSTWDKNKTYDMLERKGFKIRYYEENGNFEHFTDLAMCVRNMPVIGFLISFMVNFFLSVLPFRMIFFEPISEKLGLRPRQLIVVASFNK